VSSRHTERPGAGVLAAAHQEFGLFAMRVATFLRPRLTLGVRLVALDAEGRVLLVRHSYLPGLHLPGGAVGPGESCRLAVEREAREEGGLVLEAAPELFHVYWNPAGGRHDHVVLFIARNVRQLAPRPMSLEILSAGFHPLDRLPEDVTPATRRRLAEIAEGLPPADTW
jgi:ADP-ribose pyrophosphatase YjhB (NUDIX family)